MFVILSGLVFFAWGEIYSLFPSTCTDIYGSQLRDDQRRPALHRQGHRVAARAVRQRAAQATGSWHAVFIVAASMNVAAALPRSFVLKPTRACPCRREVSAAASAQPAE